MRGSLQRQAWQRATQQPDEVAEPLSPHALGHVGIKQSDQVTSTLRARMEEQGRQQAVGPVGRTGNLLARARNAQLTQEAEAVGYCWR